jgi:hypothetical protein
MAEIENILARLAADDALRRRFVDDPFALGRELGLSVTESRQLRRQAASRFDSFAATARERRFVEIGKLFPLTKNVLGGRFAAHFKRFAAGHADGGIERLFGDALDFADYLEGRLREERVGPGWVLDLLRYEKTRLKAADPARRVVVGYFRHDISRLVRSVARREQPSPSAARRPTVAVWWRPRRRGTVRYAVFAAPQLWGRNKGRES